MREIDEHVGDEMLELVLGHVTGAQRATLAAHLLRCATCRDDYDELAAAVGAALPGVPAVQPPIGFDAAVLARLEVARTAPMPPAARRRPARRWWLAAAAMVALVAVGAIGVAAGRWGDAADSAASLVAPIRTAADGRAVGTASIGDVDGMPVLVVALVDAPADISYTCRMRLRDGSTVTTEPWPAMARGAWVVDVPGGDADQLDGIDLVVTDTDLVWSSADL